MKRLLSIVCALLAVSLAGQAARGQEPISQLQGKDALYHPITGVPYAYLLSGTVWQSPLIAVCWENPSSEFQAEMGWVADAIAKSWSKYSKLKFGGWLRCESGNRGIRIQIDDSGPRTLGLGTQINGVTHGMLLNFTFNNWSQPCKDPSMRELCIRSIAVHEFGHAIGFAHEHNRPDRPGECTEKPQGGNGDKMLTDYDPQSVMNYCNPVYNNNGNLSQLDIMGVQKVYGAP